MKLSTLPITPTDEGLKEKHEGKKFLNQVELSRRWGISARTLEQWRWRNVGPTFVKIGNCVRYRIDDVERYEQQRLMTCPEQQLQGNLPGGAS